MAILSVLAGGMMGFFSAIVGLVLLNLSWMAAMGIWTGVGCLAAIVILGISMAPISTAAAPLKAERA